MGVMYCIRLKGLFIVTLLRPNKQLEELCRAWTRNWVRVKFPRNHMRKSCQDWVVYDLPTDRIPENHLVKFSSGMMSPSSSCSAMRAVELELVETYPSRSGTRVMVAQVWRWPWRNRLCGGRKRWDVPAPVSFARYLVFVFQERRPPLPFPCQNINRLALTDISFLNSVYVLIILSFLRY